jgi:hypothetical protein
MVKEMIVLTYMDSRYKDTGKPIDIGRIHNAIENNLSIYSTTLYIVKPDTEETSVKVKLWCADDFLSIQIGSHISTYKGYADYVKDELEDVYLCAVFDRGGF